MRCVACDDPLSPKEESMKSQVTGEDFLLCTPCLGKAGLLQTAVENPLAEEDVYMDISRLEEDFK